MNKYQYTDKCDEISGFGDSYEEGCRKMVIAGMEWFDMHPDADPKFEEFKNVMGLVLDKNEAATQLTDYMNDSVNGEATGAMMQACLNHIKFARQHGWDKYIAEMESRHE